jgi:hypothetical protein
MKVANLIDITPEEIAKLEALGYVGMNVNLATGKIDLVKAEDYNKEEENGCECGNYDCCYPHAEECCGCGHCICEEEYYEEDEDEEIKEKLADCADTLAEIIHKIIG